MNKLLFCALLLLAGAAIAQQPAPATPPAPQDSMEPGVNTSAPASTPAAEKPAAAKPSTTNTGAGRC
jgi:uncharacterized lipoprotein YajG